ncbi:MAG: hypothetical protein ACK4PG_05960 [Acetobacteraceae bacterium]
MDRRDVLPAILLALFGLGIHAASGLLDGRVLAGILPDTDSYARLIRVRELWEGAGWSDPVTPSFNAPEGLFLHWTRPLDVLILLPALLLHAAGLARDEAILWSGAVVCPVLHVAAALCAVWAARALWPRSASWLAGLFVLSAMSLRVYSEFGRADHHTLIALAGVLVIGFGLHALRGRRRAGHAVGCGVAGGAGLWVSPEAILFLAPMLAGFGAAWATGPRPRSAALQGLRASLAAAAVVALAILTERGAAGALLVAYDLVALPHLALCLAAAAVFAVAVAASGAGLAGRAAIGAAAGGVALALLLRAFPGLPSASMADAGPVATAAFLPRVDEMQPLRFDSDAATRRSLMFLGAEAFLAPFVLLLSALPWLRGPRAVLVAPLVFLLAVNGWAAVQHLRFTADLAVPAAILAAGLPVVLGRLMAGAPILLLALTRTSLVAAVLLFPVLVVLAIPPAAGAASSLRPGEACGASALARLLAAERPAGAGGERPILFADDIDVGPALAWGGGVRVVGGPYHRGESAFADTRALFAAPDAEAALALLRRREASLLLICKPRRVVGEGFRTRLLAGEVPGWLEPVPLPEGLAARARLFRVLPEAR